MRRRLRGVGGRGVRRRRIRTVFPSARRVPLQVGLDAFAQLCVDQRVAVDRLLRQDVDDLADRGDGRGGHAELTGQLVQGAQVAGAPFLAVDQQTALAVLLAFLAVEAEADRLRATPG